MFLTAYWKCLTILNHIISYNKPCSSTKHNQWSSVFLVMVFGFVLFCLCKLLHNLFLKFCTFWKYSGLKTICWTLLTSGIELKIIFKKKKISAFKYSFLFGEPKGDLLVPYPGIKVEGIEYLLSGFWDTKEKWFHRIYVNC